MARIVLLRSSHHLVLRRGALEAWGPQKVSEESRVRPRKGVGRCERPIIHIRHQYH